MQQKHVALLLVVVLAIVLFAFLKTRTSPHSASTSGKTGSGAGAGKLGSVLQATVNGPAREVAGTVYLDELPAPGATVRLLRAGALAETSTRTDAAGHFSFAATPVAAYHVVAEVQRATGAAVSIDLRDPATPVDKLRLVAHACQASIHGVVRDASGGAIASARVLVLYLGSDGPGTEAADDGSYDLCVPVGDSSVVVRADGYADALAQVSAFGRMHRDFELVPEAVVAGRTVKATDGSPVAGAQLTLQPEDFAAFQRMPRITALSDPDGHFRLRGVTAGRYTLSATADHLATAEGVPVVADVAAPAEDIVCSLQPALIIAGHVVDKLNKKPVADMPVFAESSVPQPMQMSWQRDTSHEDGSFAIEHVLPGEYRVRTRDDIRSPTSQQVKLDKTDVDGLVLEVEPQSSIAGRVTRAGKPVEGAQVDARATTPRPDSYPGGSRAFTDADGRFTLHGVRAGAYQIYAESKRLGAFTQGPTVTVAAAEAKMGVEIEMELAGSIAGTVVDQAGAPVAGVHLRFSLVQGRDFGEATTADDGTFRAGALSGGGDYTVDVRPATGAPIAFQPAGGGTFAPITVRDGNTQITGVQIKIQFERLSIAGRVVTSDGGAVPDVPVSVEMQSSTRRPMPRGMGAPAATTDTTGAFVIKDLPAGTYTVSARSPAGARDVEGVQAGAKNVEIRLPALGSVEGTLDGFTQPPQIYAFLIDEKMPMRYRADVAGKSFAMKNVPVGTYQLVANSSDGHAEGKVTVEAKATAHVTLHNPGIGSVEGRVTDETTHEPVPEAWCMAGTTSSPARSDASGTFRLPRVAAGDVKVECYGRTTQPAPAMMDGSGTVHVEVGKTAHVDVAVKKRALPVRAYAGLLLDAKANQVVVKAVVPGGPAEHAGIKVGDVIRDVDGDGVDASEGPAIVQTAIELHAPGTVIKIGLDRGGTHQTIDVKLEARP